jgi:molybdopterin synthase sulfur carrier subunit
MTSRETVAAGAAGEVAGAGHNASEVSGGVLVVNVRYFAAAKAAVGTAEESVAVPIGATVGHLIDTVGREWPDVFSRCSFIVNDRATTDRSLRLASGDRVDVLPPFAGG